MNYWQYIAKQRGLKFGGVVIAVWLLFYFAGFFMPELADEHGKELMWTGVFIGGALLVFFIGHYIAWRKL